jgi:peptide/nickel transport system ATP-binding protein
MSAGDVLLEVEDMAVTYRTNRGRRWDAVRGIDLSIRRGETLALVGESGCGKSSSARAIGQIPRPSRGRVWFDGAELTRLRQRDLRRIRSRMPMVFQDPVSSLNPRRPVHEIIGQPLAIAGQSDRSVRRDRARALLELVGLDADFDVRWPAELSGGQCQRVSIARALATDPKLLICDEAVSALDVSVQAQVVNLLLDAQKQFGLAMLFISHNLLVVQRISDRVGVMYLGRMCEVGPMESVFSRPRHPYSAALLASVPDPDPGVRPATAVALEGDLPSPMSPPSGCPFRTRCPRAEQRCAVEVPPLRDVGDEHTVACHFPLD